MAIGASLLQHPLYGTPSLILSDRVAHCQVSRPILKHIFLKNVLA